MIKAQIVPATAAHIEAMLPHVRQADIDEFLATNGWSRVACLKPVCARQHLPVPD